MSESMTGADIEKNEGEEEGDTYEKGSRLKFITAELQPVPRGRLDDASQNASLGAESRVESVSTE